MTLTKAIQILDLNIRQRSPTMPPDVKDALKLGKEALKLRQKTVNENPHLPWQLLPGETED